MSKNHPNRRQKRIVRAVSPQTPDTSLAHVSTAEQPFAAPATQRATPAERPLDLRVVASIALVFLVLIIVVLGSSYLASSYGSGAQIGDDQAQPTTGQSSDAAFAGIDRSDIQALMRRGKDLYDQSRFDDAVTVYQEVLRLAPDNQAAQSNLGSTFFRLQRLDEALQAFREAVRLNPNDAEARQNLGAGLAATGNYDAAINEYIQATKLKPDLATAHYSLGVLYQETNNKAKAIEELTRYLEIGADSDLKSDAQNRLRVLKGS